MLSFLQAAPLAILPPRIPLGLGAAVTLPSALCIACLIPSSRSLGGLYDMARSISCCSSGNSCCMPTELLGLGSSLNLGSFELLEPSDRNDEFKPGERRLS